MTRPRCPKCQKYYVTLMPEQRPVPARIVAAVTQTIGLTEPVISPYRRYQCDICGHRWAILVAGSPTTDAFAMHSPAPRPATLAASFLPARIPAVSWPVSAKTMGALAADRAARVGDQSTRRSGTLMAAQRMGMQRMATQRESQLSARPIAADVKAAEHFLQMEDDEPTMPRRTLTQGGVSSARYATRNAPLHASAGLAPEVTDTVAVARPSRWQDIWRSFLPARDLPDADDSSGDSADADS